MDSMIRRHTLGDLLERTAARMPDRPAVRCGDVQWSYAEFCRIASRVAAGFARQGVKTGDRVAVLSRNSHAFAAVRFALARLGAVLVPVNFMLQPGEVHYILDHAGASLLCVDAGMAEAGREAARDTGVSQLIGLPGEDGVAAPGGMTGFDELAAEPGEPPAVDIDGATLAQIVYTSGTESRPKGAMLTHDAVIAEYVSCIVEGEITSDDVILHALPLYHCAQLDVFFGPGVYVGANNVITGNPAPDNLLPLIEAHGITSFFAPPTVWISLLRSPLFDRCDLGSLRKGYYGASIMPVRVLEELHERLPEVRLWNFYGQTEVAPLATVLKPDEQIRKAGSAGRPVLNVRTRVVDNAMQDVKTGEIGEIVHRSPHLMLGYYRDAERTGAAFAGGWFHSGDLATLDEEGCITVVDRKKDMIKTGGENVASREVEETIYRLEGVSEVAVIGLPHAHWVEAVTAVVVVKEGHTLDEDAVIAHCAAGMARYKVPKAVVITDNLPKNPSGKLLKRSLREDYASLFD